MGLQVLQRFGAEGKGGDGDACGDAVGTAGELFAVGAVAERGTNERVVGGRRDGVADEAAVAAAGECSGKGGVCEG